MFNFILDPIEMYVDGTWAAFFVGTVCDSYYWWIVRDDSSGQLGVVHLN